MIIPLNIFAKFEIMGFDRLSKFVTSPYIHTLFLKDSMFNDCIGHF
jgi:hypothetical protein